MSKTDAKLCELLPSSAAPNKNSVDAVMCDSESTCIISSHTEDEVAQLLLIIRAHSPAGVHVSDLMRHCLHLGWNVNAVN